MRNLLERIFGSKYDRRMKKAKKFYTNPYSEECYALDINFVEFMIPRLELFKKDASKWIVYDFSIVDKILVGFKLYKEIFDWKLEDIEKKMTIVKESMKLFSEHWMEFGW